MNPKFRKNMILKSNLKFQSLFMVITTIIFNFFSTNFTYAQVDTNYRINQLEILRSDIRSLINNPDFTNANLGLCVQALESGEYIFNYNESKNFIPASTQKVLTTAAALELLGSDFKYSTKFYLDGNIMPDGEFIGNVIIRGIGDPSISKYHFKEPLEILENWAKVIDSMGIRSIKGNLIGDDSYFDNIYYGPGWSWDDFSYYFSSQVSALSINDNRVDFYIYSGDSIGDYARISAYPNSQYYRIINNIKTTKSQEDNNITGFRNYGTNIISLWGTTSYDALRKKSNSISVTLDNPTLFFLNLFKQKLNERKIVFSGGLLRQADLPERINYSVLNPISEHFSPNLIEILTVINQESHNLSAEMIFKTLGKESTGIGDFEHGSEYILNYVSKAGVNKQNIKIVDGSGLSRLNLMSPRSQVSVLNHIHRSTFRDKFMKTLARPGEPGTLKRRMTKSKAEKNVFAKTGSMNYVSAICGYLTTSDGELMAFSLMFQNFTVPITLANNLQDLILMRLSSFSRK
jgi:D-alanyl-D-alanine carboxypeptidase/D-alanyl-D-alanine-endopeptidase (penicillin-binding protein 4)